MYVIQQCGMQAQNSDKHLNTEKMKKKILVRALQKRAINKKHRTHM